MLLLHFTWVGWPTKMPLLAPSGQRLLAAFLTSISPSAPSNSPSLTHSLTHRASAASLLLSYALVLMDPAQSCHLDSDNFRRPSPARWRGAATGALGCKTGCRDGYHALPPMSSSRKLARCLHSLSLFFFSYLLPAYRVLIVLPIVSQHFFCC